MASNATPTRPHRLSYRHWPLWPAIFLLFLAPMLRSAETAEAMLIVVGDQHSAYDKYPQFVAAIDSLRAEAPAVPCAILIDGDAFEYGNAIARRTDGAIDFALFAALAQRAPTILNLGNHDADVLVFPNLVQRLHALGIVVVSANVRDRSTGAPFAPASTTLKLGAHELTIVGLTTDNLATFRVAIRPDLDLANPVVWAQRNLPALLKEKTLPVVLSHAGLRADREILPFVPNGTLFAGAHDHLRFVHREGRTVYFHSGSWLDGISIARLHQRGAALEWNVEQRPLPNDGPADHALVKLVHDTLAQQQTPEEAAIVGHLPHALTPGQAAELAVAAAAEAVGADVAIVGGTTFGGGLPAGSVTRYAFDACVRFDGPLYAGEIEGEQLRRMLMRTNQGPDTPFSARHGENLVAVAPATIEPGKRYRWVTTDWIARNPATYFGEPVPGLHEVANMRLKAAVLAALARKSKPKQ